MSIAIFIVIMRFTQGKCDKKKKQYEKKKHLNNYFQYIF